MVWKTVLRVWPPTTRNPTSSRPSSFLLIPNVTLITSPPPRSTSLRLRLSWPSLSSWPMNPTSHQLFESRSPGLSRLCISSLQVLCLAQTVRGFWFSSLDSCLSCVKDPWDLFIKCKHHFAWPFDLTSWLNLSRVVQCVNCGELISDVNGQQCFYDSKRSIGEVLF